MTERRQLTRSQLTGMLLLGMCTWAIIIGVIYAIIGNFLTGVIITGAGLCGGFFLLWWLYYVGKDRR